MAWDTSYNEFPGDDRAIWSQLALEDPFKVIYGWIKQNHITLKESKKLLGEVFKNEKV